MSDGTVTFKLIKPLKTHKGETSTLALKPPTAGAFVRYGMPFSQITETIDGSDRQEFKFYPDRMMRFISDMTGHDHIELEGIDGRDVIPLFWSVVAVLGNRQTPAGGAT